MVCVEGIGWVQAGMRHVRCPQYGANANLVVQMRNTIILSAVLAALTACKGSSPARESDSAGGEVDRVTPVGLTCSPAELRPNQALSLKMKPNHGPTLRAKGPEGAEYLVVFYGAGKPGRVSHESLVPPDTFSRVTEMNVNPSLLTVAPAKAGPDTNVLLFQKPGMYRFLLGSDGESDGPGHAECVVRYTP